LIRMNGNNNTVVSEFILLGLSNKPKIQIFIFVVFLIFYLTTLIGNILIIIITTTVSSLQTPMYFFLTNLSILDICVSSTSVPRMLKDLMSAKKAISYAECVTQMYMSLGLAASECFLLAIMAYDRYVAICYPLHYTQVISRSKCIKVAIAVWICGFTLTIPDIALTMTINLCGRNKINHFICEVPELLSLGCENIMVIELVIFIIGILVLIIPVLIICMSYIRILISILKIASSLGQHKPFSTCGSHMIVVTLFYVSGMAAYMKPRSNSSVNNDKIIAIFYFIVTPMLNPMIYTLRNREVISALKKLRSRNMSV
uniref:Olfactory receptor n=1 Tax=Leptobrachium leishanense TaxID=445787 RepID=A0A8C5QKZ8_9ANUR